ncbi:MAG: hypothetical protein ABIP92_07345, partial [Arthrobacter sp.]
MTRLLATLESKMPGSKKPGSTKPRSGHPGSNARRKKLIAGAAIVSAAAVLVAAAIIYPGFKTAEVQLNDGGVWVVSKSKNAVGRLNYPS